MVMIVSKESTFETPTKPVEMKRSCVASGKPRSPGEIVEVNEKDFIFLTNTGAAIPYLGEAKVNRAKKRSKKKDA